ncbi:MAG: magnesium chelatase subunit D family protein [Bacteroidota bacterium]
MNYPFTAIVGQEKLKKALLLCAINPAIGGILIRGDKGTAKSTAARALAEIVPPVALTAGCRFNCSEDSGLDICEVCLKAGKQVKLSQVPFVNLPLGASEERVIGNLDLEGVLVEKKRKLQPGLLASAHQGILYIDEVNLLADHLVDILLDVAAMGVNTIEREGLSASHPARFSLIGTMNVEEGNLRPQFLDRFGLMINVEAPRDVAERTEVVRRRIAFEADPATFVSKWEKSQQELRHKLFTAKTLLPSVVLDDALLTLISELCSGMGVKSLRADIVMYKTAITLAAIGGRIDVLAEDVREAAELVLAHRTHQKPFSEPGLDQDKLDEIMKNSSSEQQPSENSSAGHDDDNSNTDTESESSDGKPQTEHVFDAIEPAAIPRLELELDRLSKDLNSGRRTKADHATRGQYVRSQSLGNTTDIAIEATVLSAIERAPEQFEIRKEDIRHKVRTGKVGNLIIFIVDASGSMAASKRMEAVKGTVLSLLKDAYQRRDEVSVISFRGIEAKVLLQPTRSVELAEEALSKLPTGGRTPLVHALQMALQLIKKQATLSDQKPLLVVLSDGKANVSENGSDPWGHSLSVAAEIKRKEISGLLINSDTNYLQLGKAATLAEALGMNYISLTDLNPDRLISEISRIG